MLQINAPDTIQEGILLYVPAYKKTPNTYVTVEFYFSKTDPRLFWTNCDKTLNLIYSGSNYVQDNGNIFIYDKPLDKGFYSIRISVTTPGVKTLTGSEVIGFLKEPTKPLIIGLPYSVYPPITIY